MKIKIIQGMSERSVERKVNDFLSYKGIKVLELQYSATIFYYSVMIVYEEIYPEQ